MRRYNARPGQKLLLFGACLLGGATLVLAQGEGQDKAVKPAVPAPSAQPPAPKTSDTPAPKADAAQPPKSVDAPVSAKPGEKLISFEMRDKPWPSVLDWLADQSGLPIMSIHKPTGSFTYIAPRSAPKNYTIPQVVDILNEALFAQKYIIIRRPSSFTIVPADEPIDRAILPRLNLNELDEHGTTELASVVVPLTKMVAEDAVPEVRKMMGPFGEVVALNAANQLLCQDTVGNLKRIIKTLKDIEESDKESDTFTHECKYIKAREAERILRDLLGDSRTQQMGQMQDQFRQMFQGGFRGGDPSQQPGFPPGSFPGAPGGFQMSDPRGRGSDRGSSMMATTRVRMHYIATDERNNTVLVTGPANITSRAREIMKQIDKPQQGQPPVIVGPPILKPYPVPSGNADAIARALSDVYRATINTGAIRISATSPTQIMVWAPPEDQFDIAKQIQGSQEKSTASKLIPLTTLDALKVSETLKGMFGDVTKSASAGGIAGAPYIEADTGRNALIVRGTAEQVAEVQAVLSAIGDTGISGSSRIINLDQGNPATMAEEIRRLMQQLRPNQVDVLVPGASQKKSDGNDKSKGGGQEEQEEPKQDPAKGANKPQLVDPREEKKQPAPAVPPRDPKAPPVKITVFGNKLYVTSDDPEALMLVQELVRQMTKAPSNGGNFEVIRLNNANATDVAKILDEAFNGTRPSNQQGGGVNPFQFGFRGMQSTAATTPTEPRLRVVADPATNSLLVRASPLDMLEIRRLLKESLDADDEESRTFTRTYWIGPLKFARAYDVSTILKDVFKEQTGASPSPTTVGGFPGLMMGSFGRGGRSGGSSSALGRSSTLNIGVDDQSNSLVLACSERMYEDVKKLVDQLELAAKDSTKTIKIVPLKGIDPMMVQEAIDLVQGRRPAPTTNSQRGSGGMGFGGGGFPGGGGFSGNSMGGFRGSFGGGSGFGGGFPGGSSGFGGSGFGGSGRGSSRFGGGDGGGGPSGGSGRGGGSRGGSSRGPQSNLGTPTGEPERGRDFFAQRVTDDPRENVLFDPRPSELDRGVREEADSTSPRNANNPVQTVSFEEAQQPPAGGRPQPGAGMPGAAQPGLEGETIRTPRSPVYAEALESLGAVILRADNPADLEAVQEVIQFLLQNAKNAEVSIQVVPLEYADPLSVATTMTQLYQYVNVGASSTIVGRPQGQQQFPGGFNQNQQQQQGGSVFMLPLLRFNALLVATSQARAEDVKKQIQLLDKPTSQNARAIPIPLKRAGATRVASLITNFYSQRYPNETTAQNHVRVTADDNTNTIFVQASPADLEEIRGLVERIDNNVSSFVSDLRIVFLRNSLPDDMANLLQQAVQAGFSTAGTSSLGLGLNRNQGTTLPGQIPQQQGAFPGQTPAATLGTPTAGTGQKMSALRFVTTRRDGQRAIEAGMLDDVHITSDPRINALILAAPSQTMELLLALIKELDVPPANKAEVKVFQLRKADATLMASTIQQLFLGTTSTVGAGQFGAAGQTTTIPRSQFILGGTPLEGAQIIDLRLTVDSRTNSLIVGGSQNDMEVIEALISRLEDSDVQQRRNEVYQLKNASATDVANALNTFKTQALPVQLSIYSATGATTGTPFQEFERDIVIVPEPISNKLLISATPQYFADLMRLVSELDMLPPQVVIQVLVAEVDLSATEDFGLEVGLQSPIFFARSIIPQTGQGGTVSYANTGAPANNVNPGVTVNGTLNPAANPGFNFNTTAPLPNNPVAGPGIVGVQGLSKLGVGRGTSDVGGFVFSAASDSFSFLLRALKTQGRVDIMARPQVMTLNNQTATVNVGKNYPIVTGTTSTLGVINQNIARTDVGINLSVTPFIMPDGTVLMRVTPNVSSIDPIPVDLGNGNLSTAINQQVVDTSVLARDGESVVIGGLISKADSKSENKIPWLGDLPWVGAAFRYRTMKKTKVELLVILTPRVVRTQEDRERVMAMESRRMDWIIGDVLKTHGPYGLDAILPQTPGADAPYPDGGGPLLPGLGAPTAPMPSPMSTSSPTPPVDQPPEQLPKPQSGAPTQPQQLPPPTPVPAGQQPPSIQPVLPGAPTQPPPGAQFPGQQSMTQPSVKQAAAKGADTKPAAQRASYWGVQSSPSEILGMPKPMIDAPAEKKKSWWPWTKESSK